MVDRNLIGMKRQFLNAWVMDHQGSDNIYLIGDSHAAQLTFPLKSLAKKRGVNFYFINSEIRSDYPYSFWERKVNTDRILEHLLNVAGKGDMFLTTFHRGRFNPHRDSHFSVSELKDHGLKAKLFEDNFSKYIKKFELKGIKVFLIKDGPLLLTRIHPFKVVCLNF